MEIAIGFDGSMVVKDTMGQTHIFCPQETKRIQTAIYKWVQNKGQGLSI